MTFDEMRKHIPASGLSKLIMSLERNKYRKDVSKIWEYWDKVRLKIKVDCGKTHGQEIVSH